MKLLIENWRKHLKEGEEPEYDVGAQPGGKNKVYVLTRRYDNEDVDIVGVYSSEELAQKGIESDIEAWRAQPDRMAQPPSPEDYETEDFELDDRGNAAPAAAAGTKTPDGSAIPDQWAQETKRPWEP